MNFSGKKIIAAKSGNILPYFKVNLSDSQTLPLSLQGSTPTLAIAKLDGTNRELSRPVVPPPPIEY